MRFCYDFVVGDDWTVALGVVVSLALTFMLAHAGVPAWWIMPVAVVVLLVLSLRRAVARRSPAGDGAGRDRRPLSGPDPGGAMRV